MSSSHTPRVVTHAAVDARGDSQRIEHDLTAWKSFLRAEDRRCDELHLAAALVTIGLRSAGDFASACDVLDGVLRPTDRIGVLCPDELSVLLLPVADIHDAQRTVQQIDAALRVASIEAHVGWAMRLDGHGLFHAAARADAAMLTAKGHGHGHLDLSKR